MRNGKTRRMLSAAIYAAAMALSVACAPKPVEIIFNDAFDVSGEKFSLKDINPDLPSDWDGYNYVVLEYKISTSQRFHLGFTTDWGYSELKVMSYCPGAWNKLAIPLRFYTDLPGANVDLAATYNQPRYTGWVNLGGERGPMHGVDSIGVRIYKPVGKPVMQIRNVTLSVEDPGDLYMGDKPAIDMFGQSNLVEYGGKVHSLEELQAEWQREDADLKGPEAFGYSRFGGCLGHQVEATGFFRTEKIDGRWWFVDPDGYLFLSVGADCISLTPAGNLRAYDKRRNMYAAVPPDDLFDMDTTHRRFGEWNVIRRYGSDYQDQAMDKVFRRMDSWGINTIGNWSAGELMDAGRKAFMVTLRTAGVQRDLMGLADVYGAGFETELDRAVATTTERYKDNPWVIGYFIGNEPAWIGQEVRLCGIILDGDDRPIKKALEDYIKVNGDSDDAKCAFIHDTFEKYIRAVKSAQLRHDPNHLNLGYRFGDLNAVNDRLMGACAEVFDVLSFNCYAIRPNAAMMDRALRLADRPMIIGEYHFGSVDRGYAPSLIQVPSQKDRGIAYRYYTEQAYSHPSLVGTAYFQWSDQDITGRMDGENYNCGIIDVTDRPYKEQVEAMIETAKTLYDVHSGNAAPYDKKVERVQEHGNYSDIWNK